MQILSSAVVDGTTGDAMAVTDDGFEALLEPFYHGKHLTDPISTPEDKWQLLPAFLKVKGEPCPACRVP